MDGWCLLVLFALIFHKNPHGRDGPVCIYTFDGPSGNQEKLPEVIKPHNHGCLHPQSVLMVSFECRQRTVNQETAQSNSMSTTI